MKRRKLRRWIRQLESLVGFLGESAAYWAEQYQAIAEFAAPPSTAEPSSQAESEAKHWASNMGTGEPLSAATIRAYRDRIVAEHPDIFGTEQPAPEPTERLCCDCTWWSPRKAGEWGQCYIAPPPIQPRKFRGETCEHWKARAPSTPEPSSQAESAEQPGTPAEDTDAARFDGQRKARWPTTRKG